MNSGEQFNLYLFSSFSLLSFVSFVFSVGKKKTKILRKEQDGRKIATRKKKRSTNGKIQNILFEVLQTY